MRPTRMLASTGVAVATAAYLAASALGLTTLAYVTKPLIVVSCLWLVTGSVSPLRPWVLAGLVFSLGGDIALMWPRDYFVTGLGLFLVAHLCYIRACTMDGWRASPIPALVVGGYLMATVLVLLPSLGAMRLPVTLYATAISIMAWQALERAAALQTSAARFMAFGAVLFVTSDTTLAVNRFVTPVPLERILIMATYAMAQWAIATGASQALHARPE